MCWTTLSRLSGHNLCRRTSALPPFILCRASHTSTSDFLKFSPLPQKPNVRTELYIGPKKWPPTDSFYRPFKGHKKDCLDTRSTEGIVAPLSVNPGDIVELLSRDGTVQGFGLVTFSLVGGMFDYIDVSGERFKGHVDEVSFAIRGNLPEKSPRFYELRKVVPHLRYLLNEAASQAPALVPILTVVHAQLALSDRPRAVDYEDICRRAARINLSARPAHDAGQRLAIYLAMAYHSLYFVRTHRTPFALVSAKAISSVNKVMNALTRVELEHGCSQLVQGKQGGIAKTLKDFMDHWALWNDTRIARAAQAILEICEGSIRKIDSSRAMSSALSRLPGINLFPWISSAGGTSAEPNYSQNAQKLMRSIKSEPNALNFALFTTNSQSEVTLLTNSVAARFDESTNRLQLSVPLVRDIPSVLGSMSEIGIRSRSTVLNQTYQGLLSMDLKEKCSFQLYKKTPALRFSIEQTSDGCTWDFSSIRFEVGETIPSTVQISPSLERALSTFEPTISDHELELPPDKLFPRSKVKTGSNLSLSSLLAQSALGHIAGVYMKSKGIEAPYLRTVNGLESLSDCAGRHERLNVNAYVPISRPFDSSLSLLAQRQLLTKPISRFLYGGHPRPTLGIKIAERLLPQLKLLTELERRSSVAQTLQRLQSQLEASATFHIFRCVLLESSGQDRSPQGKLLNAFCLDLGIKIELFVPPHTEKVFAGDQVIGTEILELDPLQALFIVSI